MYKIWSKNICTFLRYHDYHIGTVYYAHSCTSVVTSYTHFVCISAKCDFFSYLIVLCTVISLCIGLFVSSIVCCVTFAESEPYCHSILFVCLLVIPQPTAYHDWSITTRFGRQVYTCPWTCVSLFGSPISHTFGARGKMCKISPISKQTWRIVPYDLFVFVAILIMVLAEQNLLLFNGYPVYL